MGGATSSPKVQSVIRTDLRSMTNNGQHGSFDIRRHTVNNKTSAGPGNLFSAPTTTKRSQHHNAAGNSGTIGSGDYTNMMASGKFQMRRKTVNEMKF